MDFVDTRRTPLHIGCICNIVVIDERCVIVDIIDIVGSGGVIGNGSCGSNACASVAAEHFYWSVGTNNNQQTYIV